MRRDTPKGERMEQELQSNKGIDDFKTLRETNCYYVDKTRFIRPLLSDPSRVELFTRPRRFGKTLTMGCAPAPQA